MFHSGDDIGAIVADIGSSSSRIGFAGDDMPRAYLPSVVGSVKDENETIGKSLHFDLSSYRKGMVIEHPIIDGVISDWDLTEKLIEHSMKNYLNIELQDRPLLMAEKPYNSPESRHKSCELMLEKFGCSAFFLSKDAVLSCYAAGKTSGLVVDCGASGTVVAPVLDGWIDAKGITRSVVGGRCLDAYTRDVVEYQQLQKRISTAQATGLPIPTETIPLIPRYRFNRNAMAVGEGETAAFEAVITENKTLKDVHMSYDSLMNLELGREIKETVCKMAENTLDDNDPRFANIPQTSYELPDGTIIDTGIERFQVPELLIDPTSFHMKLKEKQQFQHPELTKLYSTVVRVPDALYGNWDGIPALVSDSVIRSDPEVQTNLLANMILTGGGSCFENMAERIKLEVERKVHASAPGWKIRIMSVSPAERPVCAWLGGSIVASLGSFHQLFVSRAEYEEFGTSIIDRKCP